MINETLALTRRWLTKWTRSPFLILPIAIQAIFWLTLFGNSFNPASALSSVGSGSLGVFQQAFGGAANYITFLTPGVIGIVALAGIGFQGSDLLMDRINGYLGVLSTYPIPRASIYFGCVLQSMAKALTGAAITFMIALVVPDGLRLAQGFGVVDLLGIFAAFTLLIAVFSNLCTGIAISVKSTNAFFGMINLLTFPIMFTSTAFFPLSFFPGWLKPIVEANPISMANGAARLLIVNATLTASQLSTVVTDLAGLSLFVVLFAVLGIFLARNALRAR
jgi:ABC-2 type transport system permease protein